MRSTDQPFSNAQLTFVRKTMPTLKASLVKNVRENTRATIADIVQSRPKKDSFEGDKRLVDLVRRIVQSDSTSSGSMKNVKNAAKKTVLSEVVIGHITQRVARSDQLMKPIAVFVRDQVYHQVQVKLAGKTFLHSQKRLSPGEEGSVRFGRAQCKRKDENNSTANYSEKVYTRQNPPINQPRKGKRSITETGGLMMKSPHLASQKTISTHGSTWSTQLNLYVRMHSIITLNVWLTGIRRIEKGSPTASPR